ncbi:MAG TPA: hypothetical protein VMG10_16240 [Gemmataceae bacterium]|nr:hypothetical protein [Gemmataceae bacterium]
MKLSRGNQLLLGGAGIVLLLVIGLIVFATSGSNKIEKIKDPNVCEFCGRKFPKSKICLTCMAEMGREEYEARRARKEWYNSPAIATAVISVLCVLILIHISILLWKRRGRKKAEVEYHTRCKKCGRKLRYRESQINRLGKCPLCQKPLVFPKPPDVVKMRASPWVKIVKIARAVWD